MLKLKNLLILQQLKKKNFFLLIILFLFASIIDIIGVVSIFPFISILTNLELIETNKYLNFIYRSSFSLGIKDLEEFLFIFGLLVFFLFITSITSRALVQHKITKFAFDCEYELSKKLIENYLHRPYVWFLNQNSSNLSKNVLLEVSQVTSQYLIPVMNIFVQTIIIIAIFIILFIVDYLSAIILTSVFILSFSLVFVIIKKFLINLGLEAARANKERFFLVNEGLSGIKELKVRGLEQFYINRFDNPAKIYSNNQSLAQTLGFAPRYLLEAIGFGSLIILILVLMSKGKNFQNIIPVISLYAFAGYRLLPSIQQIYSSITQIRFSKTITSNLTEDLSHTRSINDSSVDNSILFKEYFELKNISFSYLNQKNVLLKNINMRISYLSRAGIIGDSGSGKTTLIDLIIGLLDPTEGTLSVDGKIIDSKNKKSWQKILGYAPQQIYLSDSNIAANIAYGIDGEKIDLERVKQVAKIVNMHDFISKELPNQYLSRIGERGVKFSGGQRQRLGIARALYHQPKVLILDEATNALDNSSEEIINEAIDRLDYKITTIQVSHRINSLKYCDSIFLLSNGKLKLMGDYKNFLKSNESFQMFKKFNL